ncbi:unnamed protein product [Lupinus luteus]|uniref:Flavin-containing monooxygenase n=1 Tax=Lupinus luteus TaxID=3873 RepID=A0AAV1W2V5_LUPLU
MPSSVKVAVIGAGAAGLVAARELHRECHNVVVVEKNNRVGGTWVVILIGLGPSSFDISREIASVAKEVHVAVKPNPKLVGMELHDCGNIKFHSMIKCVHEDGLVAFEDGFSIYADAIIHCTGYN